MLGRRLVVWPLLETKDRGLERQEPIGTQLLPWIGRFVKTS